MNFHLKKQKSKYGNVHYAFTTNFLRTFSSFDLQFIIDNFLDKTFLARIWQKIQVASNTHIFSEKEFINKISVKKIYIKNKQAIIFSLPPPDFITESFFVCLLDTQKNKKFFQTAFLTLENGQDNINFLCCWVGDYHFILSKTASASRKTFVKMIEKNLNNLFDILNKLEKNNEQSHLFNQL